VLPTVAALSEAHTFLNLSVSIVFLIPRGGGVQISISAYASVW
jgi:hypothetical protein